MLIESNRMKLLPTFAYVVGGTMTITIIGAVIGIPILLFGRAVKKTSISLEEMQKKLKIA